MDELADDDNVVAAAPRAGPLRPQHRRLPCGARSRPARIARRPGG
jgi:hypothetical protein